MPRKPAPKTAPAVAEPGTRATMIAGAAQLLAQRGLQATSFSEVLELTQAPRGSLYHHFPKGKDELVEAALELVDAQMAGYLAQRVDVGGGAEGVTHAFLELWRIVLTRSQFQSGCAVVAVTVATDSEALIARAAAIFRNWRERLAALLVRAGAAEKEAASFAAFLIAACEGAVLLSRAERSLDPFELVAAQVLDSARRLAPTKKR